MTEASRLCFVLSPIGEPGSGTRRRADGVLEAIIKPALTPLGYTCKRADHSHEAGSVTANIIETILDAELVIADLTGLNPNVMYELALRHATGKPYLQMMEDGGKLPFDIQDDRTIFFAVDMLGVSRVIPDLTAKADAVGRLDRVPSPVTRAIDLAGLRHGGEAERGTALVLDELRRLRRQIDGLEVATPLSTEAKDYPAFQLLRIPPSYSTPFDATHIRFREELREAINMVSEERSWPPFNASAQAPGQILLATRGGKASIVMHHYDPSKTSTEKIAAIAAVLREALESQYGETASSEDH